MGENGEGSHEAPSEGPSSGGAGAEVEAVVALFSRACLHVQVAVSTRAGGGAAPVFTQGRVHFSCDTW